MTTFLYILSEFVSAVDPKSGLRLAGFIGSVFLFLAVFSCFFFLGSRVGGEQSGLNPGDLMVFLSPQLTTEEINSLYTDALALESVRDVTYRYGLDVSESHTGGVLFITTSGSGAAGYASRQLESWPGIADIRSQRQQPATNALLLSAPLRIGLLVALGLAVLSSLVLARVAYNHLLHAFTRPIRLMRLSGTPETTIQPPILALGVLCGVAATALFVFAVFMVHVSLGSTFQQFVEAAPGIADPARVIRVTLLSIPLGLALGMIAGVLGVSQLSAPRFQP